VAERLRASGHRVTRQRLAVFEALADLGGHRGVDEIDGWLRSRDAPFPVTSVYNAVEALESAGLVSMAHRHPSRALYEITGHCHNHFICRVCGDIIDVDVARRRRRRPPLASAVVEDVDITNRGVCAG
jgi:Fe2+ or Zn2+ uptake regulation protein